MNEVCDLPPAERIPRFQGDDLRPALDLTRTELASQDPLLQTQALSKRDAFYENLPLQEEEKIRRIDIMEQLSPYSDEEVETMVRNLFAVELNDGCNGHCYFCFLKAAPGVRAKYTFESLEIFFEKYGPMFPRDVCLYWASDPFDYQDGDKTTWDVFKVYREHMKPLCPTVSTALPKGSEERFTQFALNLMEQHQKRYQTWDWSWESVYWPTARLRISVGDQNAQRVNQALENIRLALKEKGYSDSETDIFFEYCLRTEDRFDVLQHGRLIGKHDDIQDASSFACNDGVVAGPAGWTGRVVTAPTVYEPTGEKIILLSPGKVKGSVPKYQYTGDFDESRYVLASPLLELPNTIDNRPIEFGSAVETSVLKLGRMATSLAKFVVRTASMERRSYLEKTLHYAQGPFKEVSKLANETLDQSEVLLEQLDVVEERDCLSLYVLLCRTYLSQVDFLMEQYAKGRSVDEIASMARAFRGIGRDNIDNLTALMQSFQKRELNPKKWLGKKAKALARKQKPAS